MVYPSTDGHPSEYSRSICVEIGSFVLKKYRVDKFGNDERTDGRTDGQAENSPESLDWWRRKNVKL